MIWPQTEDWTWHGSLLIHSRCFSGCLMFCFCWRIEFSWQNPYGCHYLTGQYLYPPSVPVLSPPIESQLCLHYALVAHKRDFYHIMQKDLLPNGCSVVLTVLQTSSTVLEVQLLPGLFCFHFHPLAVFTFLCLIVIPSPSLVSCFFLARFWTIMNTMDNDGNGKRWNMMEHHETLWNMMENYGPVQKIENDCANNYMTVYGKWWYSILLVFWNPLHTHFQNLAYKFHFKVLSIINYLTSLPSISMSGWSLLHWHPVHPIESPTSHRIPDFSQQFPTIIPLASGSHIQQNDGTSPIVHGFLLVNLGKSTGETKRLLALEHHHRCLACEGSDWRCAGRTNRRCPSRALSPGIWSRMGMGGSTGWNMGIFHSG